MTREEFEAGLRRDGFQEIVEGRMEPNQARPVHHHTWETRGMVLEGVFRLTCEGSEQAHLPGEIFTMAADREHTEASGPEGAAFVVGRKRS
jgi:quercetin dioxygenase-like cupin family protein